MTRGRIMFKTVRQKLSVKTPFSMKRRKPSAMHFECSDHVEKPIGE